MITAYLGVGSNLGDRKKNISDAVKMLGEIEGLKVVKVASVIETKPVGGPKQNKFLNSAIKIKTGLKPRRLLRELKQIEKKLGRKKQ